MVSHVATGTMSMARTPTFTDDLEFPATTAELIDRYGDEQIDLPNGTETVGEILGRFSPETFESPEELRLTMQCAMSRKAVGRFGYSDRDPTPLGSPYAPEQLSF